MKELKNNIYLKLGTIVFITLVLLIPTSMIRSLITEREATQNEAIKEVSSKWAEQQTISGPFVSIPYYRYVKEVSSKDSAEKIVQVKDYLHILPSQLNISGNINPEKRYRGIYEIVVRTPREEKALKARFSSQAGQNCCQSCIASERVTVVLVAP